MNNKQNIFKSVFLVNLKARVKMENIMRKYVKGYSQDRIRRRKMNKTNSNSFYHQKRESSDSHSLFNRSYSNNYTHNNFRNSNQDKNDNYFNTLSSTIYNNTHGSQNLNQLYLSDQNQKKNKTNDYHYNKNLNYDNLKNQNHNYSQTPNVFERLSLNSKLSKKSDSNKIENQIIPSIELKQKKELEECSFKPKISHYQTSNIKINKNSKNFENNDVKEKYLTGRL